MCESACDENRERVSCSACIGGERACATGASFEPQARGHTCRHTDFIYFTALRDPDALEALASCIRRVGTLVAFVGGLFLFHEHYNRLKLLAVLGVPLGIVTIVAGCRRTEASNESLPTGMSESLRYLDRS